MLRHHRCYGTAPDGRLFRGARGGPLSESSYGRTWHAARTLALGPAAAATLARRPYDLRHAAVSLWLNAGAAPAQIARRAGHSITTLLAVYTQCIDGQDDITNRQIERALHTRNQAHHPAASGSANRRYRPDPVRHMSVHGPQSLPFAHALLMYRASTSLHLRERRTLPAAALGATLPRTHQQPPSADYFPSPVTCQPPHSPPFCAVITPAGRPPTAGWSEHSARGAIGIKIPAVPPRSPGYQSLHRCQMVFGMPP
jgi:hypothetical protein